MLRNVSACVAMLVCLTSVAWAVPTVTIGNYAAGPGTVTVSVNVTSSPAEQYAGLNFTFATGPFNASNAPTGNGPIITSVNVIGPGMMFGANNTGQGNPNPAGPTARKVKATTTTASGTVPANGLLAVVTLSTVGLPVGFYQLRVTQMSSLGGGQAMNFVTNDANTVVPIAPHGGIGFVPEPSSVVLALFALTSLGAVVWRRHRADLMN